MTILDYNNLYSGYVYDTASFLKDVISMKHVVETFYYCSYFSGLKLNLKKSVIARIGDVEVVQVSVCGMRFIDLNNVRLKILGAHLSFNEKLNEKKKSVTDIQ